MIGTTGRSGGHDPQAASDLASVGETLEELYHDAPCGYISSLPDGRIVRVNETFLRWTGYEEDALLGRRLQDLLTPGGRIYHETHYAPLLRMQGSVREIALDLLCADGRTLPVLMNSVLRVDERGEPALVRTVVLDATERRGYERELLRARDEAEQAEHRAQELARTLQASLIPPGPPQIPGLDVAAIYRPAGDGAEVGGDFFDVFPLDDSTWGITIGDVEGKGVEAAALTAFVRY
ncbi:MAG TPA: PAS domain-containing protein, partial [Actinomycetota bacterium]|nr:PAS domain-containing protein [Actinomycetota bacterium]